MTTQLERPAVADMFLTTFRRVIHPELFQSATQSRIKFSGNEAVFRLGPVGHLIEFRTGATFVTEVAMTRHAPLPESMRIVERRLIGYRTHMVDLPGIRYHCSYQLENVPLDIYLQVQREMEVDARNSTLAVSVPGHSANSPDCLSYLKCDVLNDGLVVHAFHTFPDDAAILRSQTLFEFLEPDAVG